MYQVTGYYQRPYMYNDYFPQDENEIAELIYYRQHKPTFMILGSYKTKDEALIAYQQFKRQTVVTKYDDQGNALDLTYTYTDVQIKQ